MLKIATHNSATGERGIWYSWIFTPFAKCQSKTIKEQYDAGCRLFDIRIKLVGNTWRMAHGLWYTKRTAEDIMREINSFEEACHVTITYEGKGNHNDIFIAFVNKLKTLYTNIKYGPIATKYSNDTKGFVVKYETVMLGDKGWCDAPNKQGFLPLDGTTWHTYLPIPWLWDILYKRPHVFSEDIYTYVDFL